jgi:hypothetical protein
LLYEMRMVWPSQPDSVTNLLSPVPKRQSIKLRRRSRPQLRIAQLFHVLVDVECMIKAR